MDWYFGCGIEDLVVPRDDGLSDRLPSPESWSEWGVTGPEMFQTQYKRGAFSPSFTADNEEHGFDEKSLSEDADMEDFCGGFSDHRQDYQLDLVGSGSADDIFLCPMNENFPRFENLDESYNSSPKSQHGATKQGSCNRELIGSESSDVRGHGSSRYLKTHGFSPSSCFENDCSFDSDFMANDFQGGNDVSEDRSVVRHSVPFENNNENGDCDEEASLEENVLCELQMVMNQFTEKTRISFRDSLYRLAKNSDENRMSQDQSGGLFMDSLDVENARSSTNSATESGTNVIDRAIASLMFCKMDLNDQDHPTSSSSDFNEAVARLNKPFDHNNRSFCDSGDFQNPIDDAEVPIFGHGSINRSMILDFGSVAN